MSDTGPVCSCGTATIENPCPRHSDEPVPLVGVSDGQPHIEARPNRRIELKLETVLKAMGYETVRFEGHVAVVNQPARVVNLIGLFAQLLEQADDVIEGMRPFFLDATEEFYTKAQLELHEITERDLMQWGNPPKIEMPMKKASKKSRKRP